MSVRGNHYIRCLGKISNTFRQLSSRQDASPKAANTPKPFLMRDRGRGYIITTTVCWHKLYDNTPKPLLTNITVSHHHQQQN